jgi:tetratricopeptide (TPR) repeat protein
MPSRDRKRRRSALRQAGQTDEAHARLKRATERQPRYPPDELGYLLMSLERYDKAIEALRRGLEIAPMMRQLSIQLGEVISPAPESQRGEGRLCPRTRNRAAIL